MCFFVRFCQRDRLCPCFIAVFSCLCLFIHAEDNSQISDVVLKGLSKNYNDVHSITLEWESRYTSEQNIKNLLQRIKFHDFYGFEEPIYGIYIYENSKFYFQRKHKENPIETLRVKDRFPSAWEIRNSDSLLTRIDENSFDGLKFYSGNGLDTLGVSPGLTIMDLTKARKNNYRILEDGHYTQYLGFKFPNMTDDIGSLHQSFVLFLIQNGEVLSKKIEIRDGQETYMICVKSKNYWDTNGDNCIICFWLLPQYGYAIGQCDIMDSGNHLAYRVINSDFKELVGTTMFIPYCTDVQYYTFATIPGDISPIVLFRETHRLTNVSAKKININQFNLSMEYSRPGSRFADMTLQDTEHGLQYTYPANPADLDRVIEAALTGGSFVPTPLPSTGAIIVRWLLIIAGIAMILYACYMKFVKKSNE